MYYNKYIKYKQKYLKMKHATLIPSYTRSQEYARTQPQEYARRQSQEYARTQADVEANAAATTSVLTIGTFMSSAAMLGGGYNDDLDCKISFGTECDVYFDIEGGYNMRGGSNIASNLDFTTKIYNNLDGASNLFSPISLEFLLSLLHLGIIGHSNNQLTDLLAHKYSTEELKLIHSIFNNDIMSTNNILMVNKKIGINEKYKVMVKDSVEIIVGSFDDVQLLADKVNRYVETKTNGIIKGIINENNISSNDILIMVNAIYFKSNWQHPFNVANTTKMKFHGGPYYVDMMNGIGDYQYYEDKLFQLIEIPFENNNYVMGVILPKTFQIEETVNDVPYLQKGKVAEMINNTERVKVNLFLPKFVHRKRTEFRPILEKSGLVNIFTTQSDLNIIAKGAQLSKIFHEAVVIVDEIGATATAVTVAILSKEIAMADDSAAVIFKADHVFVYYIRHVPTNIFLFYGDFQG